MNERNTSLYRYISHFILLRGPLLLVEIDGETYTHRKNLPHIFFLGPGGVNACTPLQARQRRPNPLIGCVSLARLLFSAFV